MLFQVAVIAILVYIAVIASGILIGVLNLVGWANRNVRS